MNKITVIFKEVNEPAKVIQIDNDYKTLSNLCEGLIDISSFPKNNEINMCFNDEFLYNGMEPNIVTPESEGIICGPIVFMGYNPSNGSSISLTKNQIMDVLTYIKRNQVFHLDKQEAYIYSLIMKDYQKIEEEIN